jgi:hypothetical protein
MSPGSCACSADWRALYRHVVGLPVILCGIDVVLSGERRASRAFRLPLRYRTIPRITAL